MYGIYAKRNHLTILPIIKIILIFVKYNKNQVLEVECKKYV
jgi:hypothetical protein